MKHSVAVIRFRGSYRWLITLAKAVVSVAAIYFLLRDFDFGKVSEVVRRCDIRYLLAGVALAPFVPLCLAARFVAVLRKGGMNASFTTAVRITWIGQFWNFFLPGSAGGDLYRLSYVWRLNPNDRSQGFFAVFSDRVIATLLLLPFAGVSFLILAPNGLPALQPPQWLTHALWAGVAITVGLLGVGVIMRRLIIVQLRERWQSVSGKFRNASVYFKPDRDLAVVLFWALTAHLINFSVFFCFCHSLGLNVSFGQVALLLPPIVVLLMLPISINGHGVREFLFLFFFSALGIENLNALDSELLETVLALSVVGLSVDLICNLPGGLIFAFSREERFQKAPLFPVA